MEERRETRKRWIQRGQYAVAVEVEVVYPQNCPSEACLEPATIRWLDEVARRAEAGDLEYLRSTAACSRPLSVRQTARAAARGTERSTRLDSGITAITVLRQLSAQRASSARKHVLLACGTAGYDTGECDIASLFGTAGNRGERIPRDASARFQAVPHAGPRPSLAIDADAYLA